MKPNKWYETSADKTRESKVAMLLEKSWQCKMVEMPKHHWFDYCAFKNGIVVAYVEIKNRTNRHDHYPTYMISSKKIAHGLNAAAMLRIKFLLVVQFTNALMFVDVAKAKFVLNIGGTTARNDEQDIEIVAKIQMNEFRKINERNDDGII
tara:strand:+ start:79 stop:528 length:450 start_codon:yes stop_codon:yes gene_type:complete